MEGWGTLRVVAIVLALLVAGCAGPAPGAVSDRGHLVESLSASTRTGDFDADGAFEAELRIYGKDAQGVSAYPFAGELTIRLYEGRQAQGTPAMEWATRVSPGNFTSNFSPFFPFVIDDGHLSDGRRYTVTVDAVIDATGDRYTAIHRFLFLPR